MWQPIAGPGLDPRALQDRLLAGEVSAEQAAAFLVEGNRAFVNEFRDVYARFLRDLADPANLPTLFHCTAGKDRTGFARRSCCSRSTCRARRRCATTCSRTRTRRRRRSRTLRMIRFASLFRADPDDLQPLFEARESYLNAAFAAIDAAARRHRRLSARSLGVDDALRERLRANLLE